jgi:putative transposase
MMILSYKYRLLPTRRQHYVLKEILESQRQLYNAALEERIDCYRKTGKSRNYMDQCKALTELRRDDPSAAALPANIQRWTLKRLDEAYAGFFRRLKARRKAGFPGFRGKGRWEGFGFNELRGLRFDGKRLRWKGLPGCLRVHLHRPLPSKANIRSCVFRRDHKGWSVCLQVEFASPETRELNQAIGVDVGISCLAALSDGSKIPNARVARRAESEMRRRQRALARCKRGSNRRRKVRAEVTRWNAKIATIRRTYLHQVSAQIVRNYELIAVERLNVKGLAASNLARDVHDAAWAKLREMLRYKAERAGARLIKVDPRYTSQDCSGCGTRVRKTLADRTHYCGSCGLVMDRDENAARNVLHKAVLGLGLVNVTQWGERGAGNLSLEAS